MHKWSSRDLNNKLKNIAFTLIALFHLQNLCVADESIQTLTLAVNSPGTPPTLYYDKKLKKYAGIVPDLLEIAQLDGVIKVNYLDSHRSRSESFVYEGKVDMFVSSLDWIKEPEKVISTLPIANHKSYLYATKPFSGTDIEQELNKTISICTRRGFSYPSLENWFSSGKVARIDSNSHLTMLRMLVKNRCDILEMSDRDAKAMMKTNEFIDTKFYRLDTPTSVVHVSFLMHASLTKERDILNKYIEEFKKSGAYNASINKHSDAM